MQNEDVENIEYACNICKLTLEYYKRDCLNYPCKRYYFDKLFWSFKYEGKIRKLMLDFKFQNQKYLYKFFSSDLIQKIDTYRKNNNITIDFVISVPVSFKRYLERGYNQSSLIAKEISNALNIEHLKFCLIKIKHNQRQSELPHFKRTENAKSAYKVLFSKCLQGKTILLIDDIFTTGATVNECSKVLKKSGAVKVIVATSTKA